MYYSRAVNWNSADHMQLNPLYLEGYRKYNKLNVLEILICFTTVILKCVQVISNNCFFANYVFVGILYFQFISFDTVKKLIKNSEHWDQCYGNEMKHPFMTQEYKNVIILVKRESWLMKSFWVVWIVDVKFIQTAHNHDLRISKFFP